MAPVEAARADGARPEAHPGEHHRAPPIQAQPLQPRPQPLFVPGQIGVVLLQQQRRLGQVGGDHVRLGRQIPHTPATAPACRCGRASVVPHHRVHQHQRPLPAELAVEVLYQPDLPGRAQKAAVDGVKGHPQFRPVGRRPRHLAGQIQKGGLLAGRKRGCGRRGRR